jgi:hypothetical protein
MPARKTFYFEICRKENIWKESWKSSFNWHFIRWIEMCGLGECCEEPQSFVENGLFLEDQNTLSAA